MYNAKSLLLYKNLYKIYRHRQHSKMILLVINYMVGLFGSKLLNVSVVLGKFSIVCNDSLHGINNTRSI